MDVQLRIESCREVFTDTERKIASYVVGRFPEIDELTVNELARRVGVSDASVIRFIRTLSYRSFYEFKVSVKMMLASQAQRQSEGQPTVRSCRAFLDHVIEGVVKTGKTIDEEQMMSAVDLLRSAEKVLLLGVGTSRAMAALLQYRLLYASIPSFLLSNQEEVELFQDILEKEHVLVAISRSGESRSVFEFMERCSQIGAKTILLTHRQDSPCAKLATIVLGGGNGDGTDDLPKVLSGSSSTALLVDYLGRLLLQKDNGPEWMVLNKEQRLARNKL